MSDRSESRKRRKRRAASAQKPKPAPHAAALQQPYAGELQDPAAAGVNALFPDPMALLRCALRRWALCLFLGLLVAGSVGTALWFLLPQGDFKASAIVRVYTRPRNVLFSQRGEDYRTYRETQTALIRSPIVLNKALDNTRVSRAAELDEAEDPVLWLNEHISIRFTGGEIMEISATHSDPAVAAEIANSVMDAYFSEVVNVEENRRLARLAELEKLVAEYEAKAKTQRENLKRLIESLGTTESTAVATRYQALLQQVNMLQGEWLRTQLQLTKLQSELRVLEMKVAQQNVEVPEHILNQYVEADPAVVQLKERIAALETQLKQYSGVFRNPDHPRLAQLRQELEAQRAKLQTLREQVKPRILELARAQVKADLQARRAALKEQIIQQQTEAEALLKDLEEKQKQLLALGRDSAELEFVRKELDSVDQVYSTALQELTKLRVEAKAPPRAEVVLRATPPRVRDNSRKIKLTGLATLASFGLVVLAIAFIEWKRRTVLVPEDVEKDATLPVLAAVPQIPKNWESDGAAVRSFEEAFDGVRATLLLGRNGSTPRIIMVSSPHIGEGKTTLSAHLAASIARSGRSVLVVDLDLRSPSLHELFDLSREPGITDVVLGEVELEQALQPTLQENLHVLAAGSRFVDIGGLLNSQSMRELMRTLRKRYDHVILDAPPVLLVPDALEIGQYADGAVLAALRGGTRAPALQDARRRLEYVGISLLGVVLLGVKRRRYGRYHYSAYGYGYYTYGSNGTDSAHASSPQQSATGA